MNLREFVNAGYEVREYVESVTEYHLSFDEAVINDDLSDISLYDLSCVDSDTYDVADGKVFYKICNEYGDDILTDIKKEDLLETIRGLKPEGE